MKTKVFLIGCIFGLISSFVGAQEYYETGAGLRLILSEVKDAAPSPVVFAPSVSVAFSLFDNFLFRPGLSYYATDYEWRGGNEPPVMPSEHFVLSSSYVHTASLNLGFAWEKSFGEGKTFFFEGAPVFNLRFTQGSNGSVNDMISTYFWEELRFFSLALSGGLSWSMNKQLVMGTRLDLEYPLANVWDTTKPSFLQGFSVDWGFFFRFSSRKDKGSQDSSELVTSSSD